MLAVALCTIALAVLLCAEYRGQPALKAAAKLTASTAFVAFALSQGALTSTYGQLILLALALCWCGDALLLMTGLSRPFVVGIAAFALAHIVYGIAFTTVGFDARAFALAALLAIGVAVLILRWLLAYVSGRYRYIVPGYVVVLLTMVAFGAAATAAGGPAALLAGATGFAVSDIAVARNRFVRPGFVNRAFGLVLYYASQLLLAGTV